MGGDISACDVLGVPVRRGPRVVYCGFGNIHISGLCVLPYELTRSRHVIVRRNRGMLNERNGTSLRVSFAAVKYEFVQIRRWLCEKVRGRSKVLATFRDCHVRYLSPRTDDRFGMPSRRQTQSWPSALYALVAPHKDEESCRGGLSPQLGRAQAPSRT